MFCNNCGKQLPDGSLFCDGCGSSLANNAPVQPQQPMYEQPQQPMYNQPQQPMYNQQPYGQQPYGQPGGYYNNTPNPIFSNFVATLKGIFSRNAATTLANSAKSMSNEWIISLSAFALMFGLSPMLFFNELINSELHGYYHVSPNGKVFLLFTLLGALAVAASALTIFAFMRGYYHRNVSIVPVLNVVGAATLPVTAVLIVNLIFGFMGTTGLYIAAFLLFISMLFCVVLTYEGMQGLDAIGVKPLYSYLTSCSVVTVVILLFGYLFLKSLVEDALYSLF